MRKPPIKRELDRREKEGSSIIWSKCRTLRKKDILDDGSRFWKGGKIFPPKGKFSSLRTNLSFHHGRFSVARINLANARIEGKKSHRRRKLGASRMESHYRFFFNVIKIDRREKKKEEEIETERVKKR